MTSERKNVFALIACVAMLKLLLVYWGYINFDFKAHSDENWLTIWSRWDSKAYLAIAQGGYASTSLPSDYRDFLSHFPPLYSLFIKVVSYVPGVSPIAAGMAISVIAILLASVLLYKLVLFDFNDERAAWSSVLFLNLSPTSYFTLAVYSESLFLLFVIAAFYLLRKKLVADSALAAFASTLTRLAGVTLLPVYLYAWSKRRNVKDALWFLLPMLAVVLYAGLNWLYYHDPFFFIREYRHNAFSGKHLIVPFSETLAAFKQLILQSFHGNWDFDFMMHLGWGSLFTLFALVMTGVGVGMKLPWEYTIYSLSAILFFSSFAWGISNARYVFSVFPIFIVLAKIRNRWFVHFSLVVSGILLMYFTRFFVRGWWAF